jgi:predicted molibdopterin-dependent oxidoreductase YjgC
MDIQWPCSAPDHPGTPFLHKDKFTRGKGKFHAIKDTPPAEMVDDEFSYWMTTGRVHAHYHTGTMTRVSPSLDDEIKEGYLDIHPEDAANMGIVREDWIRITSRRGNIIARARITDSVKPGLVFMPFHFVECSANVLTNPACDPLVKIPEYKVCAVKLEKVDGR